MGRDSKYSLPRPAGASKPGGKGSGRVARGVKKPAPQKGLDRQQSVAEIAEIQDVHPKTVRQWIAAKCPASRRGRAFRLNDGEVQHWLDENKRTTKPGRPAEEKPPVPAELGGDKHYWLARKYRRECLLKEGELIEVQGVRQWILDHVTVAKNKMIGLGAALASMLEGRDEAERQTIIDKRVDEILNELSASAEGFGERVEAA